jgi:signal transduction histidine kinase
MSPVDVRLVVEGLLPLLRQLVGPEIRIDTEFAAESMIARVDAGQLDQALINLAINARHAMPRGGRARDSDCRWSVGSLRVPVATLRSIRPQAGGRRSRSACRA